MWVRAAAAALCQLGLLAACSPYGGGAFMCAGAEQCSNAAAAVQGVCEPTGFCSFADPACPSGRRYGGAAGGGLAGQCVGAEADAGPDPADADPTRPDADPTRPDADPTQPDAPSVVPDAATPFCGPGQVGLVACYRFEGNLLDESGNANHASPSTESYAAGRDGQALVSIATTETIVAESPSLDVAQLTMEMWLDPSEIPAAGRAGLIDNNGQYGFFLYPGGALGCTGGGADVNVAAIVAAGAWTHVACTYDGATRTLYVNGAVVGTASGGGAISTAGADGSALAGNSPAGDPYIGLMDSLRIWNVVRSAADIAVAAGT